jgi:radical SAM-linked protein
MTTAGSIGGRLANVISPTDGPKVTPDHPPVPPREPVQRWRLVLARAAIGDQGQREQQPAWEAALLASGLPFAGLDLPRPRPRFALAAPLAATIPGEAELMDLFLVERLPAWRVREALLATLPAGWRLVEAYDVWLGESALPGRVVASTYRARFGPETIDPAPLRAAATALLGAPSLVRERRKGEGSIRYDLRPFLERLEVEPGLDGVVLRMTLRHDPEKGVGRPEEVITALGEATGMALEPVELVRERLELGDPPAPKPRGRQATASPGRPRTQPIAPSRP